MTEEIHLLEMLKSPKPTVRYDACELLRVQPSISPLALSALEDALEDSNPSVRDSATSALWVHKPEPSEPNISNYPHPETKTCPYCAETIKYEAIVCRYCGRQLPAQADMSSSSAAIPATGADVLAGIGIASGIVGLIIFGIPLGGLAIVCGIIAVAMGSKKGTGAIVLGVIDALIAILLLNIMF